MYTIINKDFYSRRVRCELYRRTSAHIKKMIDENFLKFIEKVHEPSGNTHIEKDCNGEFSCKLRLKDNNGSCYILGVNI